MNARPRKSDAAREPVNHTATVAWQYLQLLRLPNVFTALADVMMGFLFVHRGLQPGGVFFCLALASVSLYLAGMVLNDVCDVEQDRRQRPERPLPSGVVSLPAARRLGLALLGAGVAWGLLASWVGAEVTTLAWRGAAVAGLLATSVVLYDIGLKRTPLGPPVMGLCRALNVLLGMSIGSLMGNSVLLGYTQVQLITAAGIGVYIAGVTWLARNETETSSRWQLASATVVMMAGIALLALIHDRLPPGRFSPAVSPDVWYLLLGLLGFTLVRRCAQAVARPDPRAVQVAVVSGIWSLIMLDAAVALLVAPPGYAILIVSLLAPTMGLGRWLNAT